MIPFEFNAKVLVFFDLNQVSDIIAIMGLHGTKSSIVESSKTDDLIILKTSRHKKSTPTHDYNPKLVKHFIEQLPVIHGIREGKKTKLLPWQLELIDSLYNKALRQLVVSLPRKSGKSFLAAALALYHLCWQGAEKNGEVYVAAVDRTQSSIIFRMAVKIIMSVKQLSERCIIRTFDRTIEDRETGSIFKALSSDAPSKHGLSPTFVIYDELGQAPTSALYDALSTAMGGRKTPRLLVISTQASSDEHIMSQLIDDGLKSDDKAFQTILHSAPEDADPYAKETWLACCPSIGHTRTLKDYESAARQAKRLPTREASFRQLYLNQRVRSETAFLPIEHWDKCCEEFSPDDMKGKECILAADLASVRDLCCIAAYFPDSKRLLAWHFTNDAQVEASDERLPYKTWVAEDKLIATSGNTTNKLDIVNKLSQLAANYQVLSMTYDRWGMAELQRLLEEQNVSFNYHPHGQGYKDMSPAIAEFERAVLTQELKHNGDPLLRWQLQGVAIQEDPSGNRKFVKSKSTFPIDGIIACTMCVSYGKLYMDKTEFKITVI